MEFLVVMLLVGHVGLLMVLFLGWFELYHSVLVWSSEIFILWFVAVDGFWDFLVNKDDLEPDVGIDWLF